MNRKLLAIISSTTLALSAVSLGAAPSIALADTQQATIPADSNSQNIVFPTGANIINVTQAPYNAVGDGKTDDTAVLQKAIDAAEQGGSGDIIYVPNGTYLVSGELDYPAPYKRIIIQGESENGTTIKLKDSASGFGDASNPKPVISMFPSAIDSTGNSFRNSIFDLTVDVGSSNQGAIGIQFLNNNQGGMRNVKIESSDPHGAGTIGLDLSHMWVGPAMFDNIEIDGFDTGIKDRNREYSQVFDNLTLKHQNVVGIDDVGNILSIENLQSENRVPVVDNGTSSHESDSWTGQYGPNGPIFVPIEDNTWGLVTIINSTLIGGSKSNVTIDNAHGQVFLRNVHTAGYQAALENGTTVMPGDNISEFSSMNVHSAFPSPQTSLNLPIEETPTIAYQKVDKWVSVTQFGADSTGQKDSTAAVQAAIDSGASTIYFPHGTYSISGTIHVHGNVQMITGLASWININDPVANSTNPVFEFDGGTAKTVVLENLNTGYGDTNFHFVQDDTPQTLVLRNLTINGNSYQNAHGAGMLFVQDVTGSGWRFDHQDVWARQINPEGDQTEIVNSGGKVWIMGLKTEGIGTAVETDNDGKTEVLGGLLYPATYRVNGQRVHESPNPAFINNNSSMSVEVAESYYSGWSAQYPVVIQETRNGVTKQLLNTNFPSRGDGIFMGLYTGYQGQ